ncbi:MAG: serine/threonine protein kinase [Lentisphaeraceae bacterium]|nr:serine/threonine protein kinase [Lentisphaeraceae bacterium]
MNPLDKKGFKNLGRFYDDDEDDVWEKNEDRAESLSERYQEKDFLASGALKNVFKVFDFKMKRYVALAELKEEIPEEEYESFINEARLTSALRHPNIITVHDFGFNEIHIPYFTMELKVGDTLGDIIQKQQKSINELLDIFIKVCDAISYAHSENIIHLDLKPDNIQVGEFGEVQVCDWGLSRKCDGVLTEDLIKGTPGFMAPEQIIPGKELDFQTDIYALGGILYSILTESLPVEGGSKTVILSTVQEVIKSPIERFPEKSIPKSLNAVVCKAMEQLREDRYKDVEELKDEVTSYLLGRSTEAEEAGFIKEFTLFIKRNKQICMLAFVSMFILIVGGFLFLVELQKQQGETESALEKLQETHTDLTASREKEQILFAQKEKTFKMFLQASKEHTKMYNLLQGSELSHAYELMIFPLYFGSPVQNLEKSLKILTSQNVLNNPKPWINDFIILNLFISQKFKELQKYKSDKYGDLIRIAEKYIDTERSGFGVLLDKDYLILLKDINALSIDKQSIKEEVMERSFSYVENARGVNFMSGKLVRELILCWNPYWNIEDFHHRRHGKTLKLTGLHLTTLKSKDLNSSNKSFLRFLKLEELSLAGSNISSLSQIDGLSIEKLDIRNTTIKNLHPHHATKDIEEVILQSTQFDSDGRFEIPKKVKLIYKD